MASPTTSSRRAQIDPLGPLFLSAPCPMWVVDRRTRAFLAVNEAATRLYGYSRDEFLAMTARDTRRRFYATPRRHTVKDGARIEVETTCDPIEWPGRQADLVVIHDVTPRASAEQALRDSQERFRLICRATSDVVWDWDIVTDKVWWNRSTTDVFGYRSDEIGAGPDWWVERIHPDERDAVYRSALSVIENGGTLWVGDYRFLRADGAYADIHDRGYVVRKGGRPVRMFGAMLDVTERRRSEQALRDSEERQRQMEMAIQDVFYLSDARTNEILYVNPAFDRIWGHDHDILRKPRAWLAAVHPDDRERVLASLNNWKPEGERPEWNQEYRIVRPDGSIRWLWARSFPVRDAKGEIVRFAGVERDITERKKAEETVQSLLSITRDLNSTLDVDVLMVAVVRETLKLLGAEGGCAGLMTPAGMTSTKFCTQSAVRDFDYTWPMGRGLAGWVAEHKRSYVANDAAHDPQITPALRRRFRVRSAICTPLLTPGGEVIGFILIQNKKDGSGFQREDEEKLTAVSRAAAVAVQNALAYHKLRESAEALRLAELKYRGIFENSVEGIAQTTADGVFLTANPALARMLGYDSPEQLISEVKDIGRQLYVDPTVRKDIRRALDRDGEISGLEVHVRRRDGTPIWLLMGVRAVPEKDGTTVHFDSMVQDITARKKTEEALREVSGLLLRSQSEERRRIARELHDSTAQNLAGLAMNLSLVARAAATLDPKTRQRLTDSLRLTEQSCRELRTLSYLLHPPELEDGNLWSAVRWYAEGFSARSGIRVDLTVPKSAKAGCLPGEVEATLFRIVQESLANIHRHSGSRRARIRLGRDKSGVTLVVRDEGRGIPTTARHAKGEMPLGVGIAGMRERVRQLGGQIAIDSTARGTCVTVTLPVRREH